MMLAIKILLGIICVIGVITIYTMIGALVWRATCAILHNDPEIGSDGDMALGFGLTLVFWPLIWLLPLCLGCGWLVGKVGKAI